MSREPDALAVVNQLRDLAADPMNRRAIVQDQGCLPGLILFLDHPNPQVVYSALLAVRYLAECHQNREKMKGELGMMLSLQNVMQKLLTVRIQTSLRRGPLADARTSSSWDPPTSGPKQWSSTYMAWMTLRRSLCEESLLKIRGVISFTFQMGIKRCIVRIRSDLKAEALGSAIASTEVMKAQQVVRGEDGEEVIIPFPEDGSVAVEQNVALPDYLPEEESPSHEPDKAVTCVGTGQDGASWLGTAANFLSRSFYW
ncbi:unnamed protein product [Oncorhynchus mykiss]|uniref:Armadillo repeat-containing protein 1 n=1 Tax=Oncorhynchus mykiss TaxID=8022 RepID=A0A060X9E7_ONCMY|nr:unnamed protein product [Oncorhynchus mykiss]